MICRLCLIDSRECINIFDIEGMELNIAPIITKHFWFEPKIDDPISNMICNACWWKIDSFHVYYRGIEEAHRKLSERFSVKNELPLVYTYGDSDIKRLYIESVKKEEDVGAEIQEDSVEVLSDDCNENIENNEECVSTHSAEVEYVELISSIEDPDELSNEKLIETGDIQEEMEKKRKRMQGP